jgi:hypothetical protein
MVKIPLWASVLIFLTCWPASVLAGPIFVADSQGIHLELFEEPCQLKEYVTNLPYRATWTEKGKTFEGCFVPYPNVGLVTAYFSDRTVALIPIDIFKKAVSI